MSKTTNGLFIFFYSNIKRLYMHSQRQCKQVHLIPLQIKRTHSKNNLKNEMQSWKHELNLLRCVKQNATFSVLVIFQSLVLVDYNGPIGSIFDISHHNCRVSSKQFPDLLIGFAFNFLAFLAIAFNLKSSRPILFMWASSVSKPVSAATHSPIYGNMGFQVSKRWIHDQIFLSKTQRTRRTLGAVDA